MRRKHALLLLLFFYMALGAAGCTLHLLLPHGAAAPSAGNATLAAPTRPPVKDSEDTEEALLPILPQQTAPSREDPVAENNSGQTDSSQNTSDQNPSDQNTSAGPQYRYTAIHNAHRLFIRSEASLDADILGYLKPGESGEVISIGEEWVLLRHGELEGYVFKAYLSLEPR